MAKLSSDLILTLHDKVSGPARGVGNSLDGLRQRQGSFAAGLARGTAATTKAASALGFMARTAAVAAPAVALAGGAEAYMQFADIERQLTRTGLKLGATRDTMAEIKGEMQAIANRYAVPIAEVMESFDSLAESGFELSEARAALGGMVKATQGLGGSGADTVATFDAARKSINLAMKDSERFFDIVAAGGSMGKFEGSDLARYLPSLLPVASRQGYEGLEGAARLVGFLEVMRDYVGSSEEAATATADIFEKISSPDVVKNFSKLGINLEKRLAKARANGEDVLVVMHDIIKEATKGDQTKLSQIFGDRDSRRAAMVLLTQIDRVKEAQEGLRRSSGGTIETNVKVVTDDAQAKIDELSNNWNAFVQNVGRGVAAVVTPGLSAINEYVANSDAYRAGIQKEEKRGGSQEEAFEEYKRRWQKDNPDAWFGGFNKELQESFDRDMQAYGRGQIDSPYSRVDTRSKQDNPGRFGGKADAQAASDAKRARQSGNLDGEQVRAGGTPVPTSRDGTMPTALTDQQQRAEYDRGRRLGETAVRERMENLSGRDALAGIVGRLDAIEAASQRSSAAASPPAPQVVSPQKPGRPSAAMQAIAPPAVTIPPTMPPASQIVPPPVSIPIPTPRPDFVGPVKAEGEAAALVAEEAGQRISSAFEVTAKAKVDVSDLDLVIRKAALAQAALRRLDATAKAVSTAAVASAGRAIPPADNRFSDIER